ncbi:hypothetical protein GJAV_G00244740 [Gymnothorax javanicus]|nr:hypothetical protein GJAV_G00244740 [Gymnothorax javanicus]
MRSVPGEEGQNPRDVVFADYLNYYRQVWPQGNLILCLDTEVTEKAKRFLLTERNPDSRFAVFDFYRTVSECLMEGRRECRHVLKQLLKATETLEMISVNLCLFPWRKEIKTLKTFTGPFVYSIKPVLPPSVVKCILESIGYRPETEMEYRLDESADSEKAALMAFELFLARLECEYLLEVMGQEGSYECMEILQQRAPQAPLSFIEAREQVQEELEKLVPEGSESASLKAWGEEELDQGCSLVDPGEALPEESQTVVGTAGDGEEDPKQCPQSLELQPVDEARAEPRSGQTRGFLTEDKSILEMQAQYPDLSFRQKPIFGMQKGPHAGPSRQKRAPKGGAVAGGDLGTSVSPTRVSECRPATSVVAVSPKLKRHLPDTQSQEKDPVETEVDHSQTPVPAQSTGSGEAQRAAENSEASVDEHIVSELTERMGQMSVKEYCADTDLKFPVEETSWQCCHGNEAKPLSSPGDQAQPIMCHPSQAHHCNMADCLTCGCSDALPCDTLTEPPQSFYIPRHSLSSLTPPAGPAPPLEEELLQTYVVVQREQKEL